MRRPNLQPAPDAFLRICPSRAVLARIGEKWASLAIVALAAGPVRFAPLQRKLDGISQKVLTQTLRNLERDGLVTRTVRSRRPLTVEYDLTPRARDLVPILGALKAWAEANLHGIRADNAAFDTHRAARPSHASQGGGGR